MLELRRPDISEQRFRAEDSAIKVKLARKLSVRAEKQLETVLFPQNHSLHLIFCERRALERRNCSMYSVPRKCVLMEKPGNALSELLFLTETALRAAFLSEKPFRAKEKQILLTGFPRNDTFFKNDQSAPILEEIKLLKRNNTYTAIYMPTHRKEGSGEISDLFNIDLKKDI